MYHLSAYLVPLPLPSPHTSSKPSVTLPLLAPPALRTNVGPLLLTRRVSSRYHPGAQIISVLCCMDSPLINKPNSWDAPALQYLSLTDSLNRAPSCYLFLP